MYLTLGHWYASSTFIGAASLIAVVVFGVLSILVMLFTASTKRQIRYSLVEDTPLLAPVAAISQVDVEVLSRGKQLASPRVTAVRLASRGRRDIGSSEFDRQLPLTIDLGVEIVKLLAVDTKPSIGDSDVAVQGTKLLIGPCTIRKRHVMTFGFLVDGEKPKLRCQNPPLNVDVRQGADGGQLPQAFWRKAALVGAGAGVAVGTVAGATGVGAAVLAGAAGTDAGLTDLAVAAALAAATAAAAWLRRHRSHRE